MLLLVLKKISKSVSQKGQHKEPQKTQASIRLLTIAVLAPSKKLFPMRFSLLITLHYLTICCICQKSSIPLVIIINRFGALYFTRVACCCLPIFHHQKKSRRKKNGWKFKQSVTQGILAHMTKRCRVSYPRTIFFHMTL